MAFGGFSKSGGPQPIAEINMVPLIDVMLVLLVIFIVTAPLLTHAVKIDLPKASSSPTLTKPDKIELAIDAGGAFYWNGEAIDKAAVMARFASEARKTPQPELHLRADRNTRYQVLADVMAEAAKVGLSKIGFVSEPEKDLSATAPGVALPPASDVHGRTSAARGRMPEEVAMQSSLRSR